MVNVQTFMNGLARLFALGSKQPWARDDLPRLTLGIYLKIVFELHKTRFSLQNPCNSLGELFSVL